MQKSITVWDFDHTLNNCEEIYDNPANEAIKFLNTQPEFIFFPEGKLLEIHDALSSTMKYEINLETGKPYLYTKERFTHLFPRIYESLCTITGINPRGDIYPDLEQIVLKGFNKETYRRSVKPEVPALFRILHERNVEIHILTKGDGIVQREKIEAMQEILLEKGCGDCMTSFRIVEDKKKPEFFAQFLNGENFAMKYCIGNSFVYDIEPGIQVGFDGIFIPEAVWETDGPNEIVRAKKEDKCIIIEHLRDLIERHDSLFPYPPI